VSWQVALSDYLMIAPHLLLGGVLALLWSKKLYLQFPLFFAYTVAELIQFLVLFSMLRISTVSATQYGVAYAIGLGVSTALRFGVIHEVFASVFRNYEVLRAYGKPVFRWVTAGLLAFGLGVAVYSGGPGFDRRTAVLFLLDRTASIAQCGLLVALLLFASYLGLSLRSHVFGIALGLGLFSSVELATAAIRTHLGFTGATIVNYLTMATYHACVLIWLLYLWLPERSPQYAVRSVPEHDLEAWNKELQRLIQQ